MIRESLTATRLAACLLCGVAAYPGPGDAAASERGAEEAPDRAALVVEVATVTRGPVADIVFADGNARAARREFLTFQNEGRVAFLKSNDDGGPLREGDAVANGELLAELDRRIDDAAAREARAALDTVRATLGNARSELERARRLRDRQMLDQSRYDAVETSYRQALADVRRAEARSDQATAGLSRLQLRAPFDGVVAFVNVREGDYVSPATFDRSSDRAAVRTSPIVVIDPSSFEILVELPVVSGRRVRRGQPAYILDGGTLAHVQEFGFESLDDVESVDDLLIVGRVASVSPAIDPGSRSIRARVVTDETVEGLSDGGYVTVWIETDRRQDAITLPMEALVSRGDTAYAFVLDPETDLVEQREVSLGLTGEERVEVTSGLAEGEIVVTKGRYRLTTGMRVRRVPAVSERR